LALIFECKNLFEFLQIFTNIFVEKYYLYQNKANIDHYGEAPCSGKKKEDQFVAH